MIKNKKNLRFFNPSISLKSRKGQISEGITWVVATIAIIIILLVSISLTSFYTKDREIKKDFFRDSTNQKTVLSYLLTKEDNGEIVYLDIKKEGNLKDVSGNLALKIFNGLYKDRYQQMWVGVSSLGEGVISTSLNGVENEFFGKKMLLIHRESYSSLVPFDKTKFFEAIFVRKP
jgi:hypothetical protein